MPWISRHRSLSRERPLVAIGAGRLVFVRGLGTPAICCLTLPALRVLQKSGEHGVSPFAYSCTLLDSSRQDSGHRRRRARGGRETGRRLCGPRRASRARSDRQRVSSVSSVSRRLVSWPSPACRRCGCTAPRGRARAASSGQGSRPRPSVEEAAAHIHERMDNR